MSRRALVRTALALAATASWLGLAASPALGIEEFDRYAVESVSSSLSSTQAGAHADFTVGFSLAQKQGEPFALTRDIFVSLPPGLIGNPQNIQTCTLAQFGELAVESECPVSSQVGVSEVTLGGDFSGTFIDPIYNMEPPGGDVVARFGLFAGPYPTLINIRVNPIDYSLTAAVEGAASAAALIGAQNTFWGVPAAPSHDGLRLTPKEAVEGKSPPGGRDAGVPEVPFLTNPTACSTRRQVTVTAVSYQLPDQPKEKSAPFPQVTGCGLLGFDAQMSLTPTSTEAASPTGLDATVKLPQAEAPNTLGNSTLKSAHVTLPEGLTINPAAGDGLAACSDEQVGFGNGSAPACPDAAKIGSAEIEVPALTHPAGRRLPAHAGAWPPVRLLARHRRTGGAAKAPGRDPGQPPDRPAHHDLRRHPPARRDPAGAGLRDPPPRLRRPPGPAGDAQHLRHLPDPLLLHALVKQSTGTGRGADADLLGLQQGRLQSEDRRWHQPRRRRGVRALQLHPHPRRRGTEPPPDRDPPAPGPARQARRGAALPRGRRRLGRLPGRLADRHRGDGGGSRRRPALDPPARQGADRRLPRRPL